MGYGRSPCTSEQIPRAEQKKIRNAKNAVQNGKGDILGRVGRIKHAGKGLRRRRVGYKRHDQERHLPKQQNNSRQQGKENHNLIDIFTAEFQIIRRGGNGLANSKRTNIARFQIRMSIWQKANHSVDMGHQKRDMPKTTAKQSLQPRYVTRHSHVTDNLSDFNLAHGCA